MNFFLLSLSFFLSLSWFLNVTHLVLQNINYGAEEGILETSSSSLHSHFGPSALNFCA